MFKSKLSLRLSLERIKAIVDQQQQDLLRHNQWLYDLEQARKAPQEKT